MQSLRPEKTYNPIKVEFMSANDGILRPDLEKGKTNLLLFEIEWLDGEAVAPVAG